MFTCFMEGKYYSGRGRWFINIVMDYKQLQTIEIVA